MLLALIGRLAAHVRRTGLVGAAVVVAVSLTAAPASAASFVSAPVPSISGHVRVGDTLTAKPGKWKPTARLTFQWYVAGKSVKGATRSTWAVPASAHGKKITVKVTGKRSGYKTLVRTSKATVGVAAGVLFGPLPAISGTARVGSRLTAKPGTWKPTAALSYRWFASGKPISGATGSTWEVPASVAGKTITVKVTGTRAGYATLARTSKATTAVGAGTLSPTPVPTVTGAPHVGSTLVAHRGAWGPGSVTLSQVWLRDGAAIAGATGTSYALTNADGGHRVSVRVTGTKTGYGSKSATSAALSVDLPRFTTVGTPTITGDFAYGSKLTASPGTWAPTGAYTYEWLRDGVPIEPSGGILYFVQGADIGHAISVRVTANRDGVSPASAVSAAARATCGLPAPTGTRVTVVHGDVFGAVSWTRETTDVVRVCPTPDEIAPTITAGAAVTVGPGVRVELIGASLNVAGQLSMLGTEADAVEVVRGLRGGQIGTVAPAGASVVLRHVHGDVPLSVSCGTAAVEDSELPSVSAQGSTSNYWTAKVCVAAQRSVTVERSVLTDTRAALQSYQWVGDFIARDNVLLGPADIWLNTHSGIATDLGILDLYERDTPCGNAILNGNTFSAGLTYADGCRTAAAASQVPLRMQGNSVTVPGGGGAVLTGAVLDDDSLTGNSLAPGTYFSYGTVAVTTSLTLPVPYADGPAGVTSLLSLEVRPAGTVRVADGTALRVGSDIHVAGHLDAGPGSTVTWLDEGRRWGMGVATSGSVTMTDTTLSHLTGIVTSGALELRDVTLSDATGTFPDDRFSPLRGLGGGAGTIIQQDGQVDISGTYSDIPGLLRQWKGSAVVRGTFVNPRPGVRLIMTCEWEAAACYVDARDVSWGSADGPFPGMPAGDLFAQWPSALMCGSGTVWPWSGAPADVSNQWIGGCDGYTPPPPTRLADAQEQFRDGVAGYAQSCSSDPEVYADACAVVARAMTCLDAARDLAVSSSTFPIDPGADDLARDVADGALAAQEAIDVPALRDVATVTNIGLQAWDIYSTLRSVADAYAACAP